MNIITAIAEAIKEGFKWASGSHIRKLRAAVEAGEKYIQTNENMKLTKKRKQKLLKHYRKRFFAAN